MTKIFFNPRELQHPISINYQDNDSLIEIIKSILLIKKKQQKLVFYKKRKRRIDWWSNSLGRRSRGDSSIAAFVSVMSKYIKNNKKFNGCWKI